MFYQNFSENKTNIIQKLLNWIFNWQISKSDKIYPSQQMANLHYFLIFPPKIGFDSISKLVDDLHVMSNTILRKISEKKIKMSSGANFSQYAYSSQSHLPIKVPGILRCGLWFIEEKKSSSGLNVFSRYF